MKIKILLHFKESNNIYIDDIFIENLLHNKKNYLIFYLFSLYQLYYLSITPSKKHIILFIFNQSEPDNRVSVREKVLHHYLTIIDISFFVHQTKLYKEILAGEKLFNHKT
jgi:hypothetical protein